MMDKRQRPYGRVYEIDADRIAEMRRRVNETITQLSALAAQVQAARTSMQRLRHLLRGRGDDATDPK